MSKNGFKQSWIKYFFSEKFLLDSYTFPKCFSLLQAGQAFPDIYFRTLRYHVVSGQSVEWKEMQSRNLGLLRCSWTRVGWYFFPRHKGVSMWDRVLLMVSAGCWGANSTFFESNKFFNCVKTKEGDSLLLWLSYFAIIKILPSLLTFMSLAAGQLYLEQSITEQQ